MSYAIFRGEGIKTIHELSQRGSHNERTKDKYKSNPNINILNYMEKNYIHNKITFEFESSFYVGLIILPFLAFVVFYIHLVIHML